MKLKKHTNGNVIIIDDAGKEINRVPSDWMLWRDLRNAPMYFYASPNGSNGAGVVIDWAKVTHLIKGTTETVWNGTADQLFTELSDNFFIKVSGSGTTNATSEQFEEINGVFKIKESWLTSFVQSIGGGGNTKPASPTLTADDSTNTLSASHALGASEILMSTNNAAYIAYSGIINVGDVARAEGYWKFKTKAATGRDESDPVSSPSFTVAGGGGFGATPLTNFQIDGVTINSNNATSTKINAGCAARKSTDTGTSTLALKTFEIGWDASWVGKNIAFGLGTPAYAGAGLNAIENAFYIGPSGAIEGKTGGSTSSLSYTLPQATTTKLRVRVVADTTYWRTFFERSVDSGSTWTVLNSGGTLSTVLKTSDLHGCIFMFEGGITVNAIKGDA